MEDAGPHDESNCWQCEAPAEPACAHVVELAAWGGGHETLGYPVRRGRRQETLTLRVPRCEACQLRNKRVGWMAAAGAAVGILMAGIASSWAGGDMFLGFIFGSLLVALASVVWDRWSGRQVLDRYPPLRRLLRSGWFYPGSA